MIRLFKKCPALNDPSTVVGMEKVDVPLYAEWREVYGDQCTIIPVHNPKHYPSVGLQQMKEAVDLSKYQRVVFTDDNAVFTSSALFRLVFAHAIFPKDIVNGTNPLGTFFHRDAISKGEVYQVPKKWQPYTEADEVTIFEQLNMTFWAMPAARYAEFTFSPNMYAWDIELHLWAVIEGGVRKILGCREAEFTKHKHDNKETKQPAWYKLKQLGESISILAERYPDWAEATWMTYHVPTRKVLKDIIARESTQE
jgi:hypothetical protein